MPSRLIEELNRYLVSSQTPEMFVTLFLGLLDCDKSRLWYVNCGHPPAIVLRSRDAKPETLGIGGMVLGVKETAAYEVGQCRLEAGDTLVLVSDGVTEARNLKNQLYGETRLAETWSDDHDESASETMQRILSSVDGFMEGADQADDISILVLKSRGQLSGNW
jgi:sigma-B regulation protein RsbU (phosphoserine phosphatase)